MGYTDVAASAGKTLSAKVAAFAPWLLPVAVAIAAILWRFYSLENADVSWLLTAAEKFLDDPRDLIEFNPPGATFTYVPAIWVARFVGVEPELACDVLVLLIAAVSLGFVSLVLGRHFAERHNMPLLAAGAVAILLVLPAHTFGERELLGVMLLLPWTAVLAARLEGSTPRLWLSLCAGLAGGLCIVVKPHFILNVGLLSAILVWRTRSWRSLFAAENCAAAFVALIYGLIVWIKFPDYVSHMAPMLTAVYVPDRLDFTTLLGLPVTILLVCIVALFAVMGAPRRGDALPGLLLAMSGAAYFSFLLQGKGWPYQSYPAISFALLALAVRLSGNGMAMRTRAQRVVDFLGALAVFFTGLAWLNADSPRDTRALARAIEGIAQRPTIAAITSDLSIGFPATRMVHGRWAQRSPSLLIAAGVRRRKLQPDVAPKVIAAIEPYEALDRSLLRDDIRSNRPEILLVESQAAEPSGWLDWARADPQFASTLDANEFVEQLDDVQIWRRR
jgi:hypothetical protein